MTNTTTAQIGAPGAGFAAHHIRQTSLRRVRLNGAALALDLADNPRPQAEDGYAVHDALLIENHGRQIVEWFAWAKGRAKGIGHGGIHRNAGQVGPPARFDDAMR